jgi:hypothetical protein
MPMGTPHTQSGWLLERPDLPHGNFEIIFDCPRSPTGLHGISHLFNDNGAHPPPDTEWQEAEIRIGEAAFPGPMLGASLIFSNYGNLEAVATQADGRIAHFALVGIWGWQGPALLPGSVGAGPPAFIQSRFGGRGNFEVIVPRVGGGLAHFWRDNDHGDHWAEAAQPATAGTWSGVGLIHSSFGNLELVGVVDGVLVFLWQNGVGGPWSAPTRIDAGFIGRPALIQSSYGGSHGNFEVVAARSTSQRISLSHFWRNNSDANLPWSHAVNFRSTTDTAAIYEDVTLIQSSFNRLEVLARLQAGPGWHLDSAIAHFRAAWAAPWEEAGLTFGIPCP